MNRPAPRRWLAPAALAAALMTGLPAQASEPGPYLIGALGRTAYDYDCYFFADCRGARSTTGKLGAGFRFGVFGVEAWVIDWGRVDIRNGRPGGESLQLRTVGAGAVWHLAFSDRVQGLLRVGLADAEHQRTADGTRRRVAGTFGLGLSVAVAGPLSLDLAWDITSAEGNSTGTVLAQSATAGLRLRF